MTRPAPLQSGKMTTGRFIGVVVWLIFLLALLFWLFPGAARAQVQEKPVTTQPLQVTSSNSSTTVTVTNTFQQVFAISTTQRGRAACTIVNYGANTMWVFEDSTAAGLAAANAAVTATKAKSVQLAANQPYYCGTNGTVIRSAVFITGTSGDAFYAAQQ